MLSKVCLPLARKEPREKNRDKEIERKREWQLDRTFTTLALSLQLHQAGHVPKKSSTTSNFLFLFWFCFTEMRESLILHITRLLLI